MNSFLDILYCCNLKLSENSKFWETVKINSVLRLLIRILANSVVPIGYRLSQSLGMYTGNATEKLPIVVSLTSFPARINRVWIVIEAILRQQFQPERIILWLSREQFPGKEADLPKQLIKQKKRGLEIRFVEGDFRSHKKYYYSFNEFKEKYVLTIDDDLLFPSTFVKDVYECALRNPNSVIANFGSRVFWDNSINYIGCKDYDVKPEETGSDLFFGSGGGTLFKPSKMEKYLDDIDVIWKLCPTADDIYLNAITRLAGMTITFMRVAPLLSLSNKQDVKLTDFNGNIFDPISKNADQLRDLVAYLKAKWGYNPFAHK